MILRAVSLDRDLKKLVEEIGAEQGSLPYFLNKSQILFFQVYDLKPGAANILKQELLSRGGDLVVHRQSAVCQVKKTDALMLGTPKTFRLLLEKLGKMPYFNFPLIKEALEKQLNLDKKKKTDIFLPSRNKLLNIWQRPLVMGILNITPDSFYVESRLKKKDELLYKVEEMIAAGVDILDIGGESTRPGAEPVALEEELERVVPALELIRERFDVPISIDTYKAEVASNALVAGADIINDISGLSLDQRMVEVAAATGAPVIMMHMKGNPGNMQDNPVYKDVMKEICNYFSERIRFAVDSGIKREQIILDPGIGFGKRLQDNLEIIKYFAELKMFDLPLLLGASRKSLIRDVLKLPVDERLEGTLAVTAAAVERGANIIRVHDVKENRRLIDMLYAIKEV